MNEVSTSRIPEGGPKVAVAVRANGVLEKALLVSVIWAGVGLLVAIWLSWVGTADYGLLRLDHLIIFLPFLPLAAVSYSSRILRCYLLAKQVAPRLSFGPGIAIQSIGFALSVTPGKAGEMLKFHLMERHTGVPMARLMPVFLIEKLTEAAGLGLLVVGAGMLLPGAAAALKGNWWWGLAFLALILALIPWRSRITNLMKGRGFLRFSPEDIDTNGRGSALKIRGLIAVKELLSGGYQLLGFRPLLSAFIMVTTARFFDSLVVYFVVKSLGLDLPLAAAVFALATAAIVGGVSMLPGGLGAVEVTLTGLLISFGAEWHLALAATLIARVFTVWLWVALGLLVATWFVRTKGEGELSENLPGIYSS